MKASRHVFDWLADQVKIIRDTVRALPGEGKHSAGRRPRRNHKRRIQAARKRQRQARRYARMCAGGRKHRYKS